MTNLVIPLALYTYIKHCTRILVHYARIIDFNEKLSFECRFMLTQTTKGICARRNADNSTHLHVHLLIPQNKSKSASDIRRLQIKRCGRLDPMAVLALDCCPNITRNVQVTQKCDWLRKTKG